MIRKGSSSASVSAEDDGIILSDEIIPSDEDSLSDDRSCSENTDSPDRIDTPDKSVPLDRIDPPDKSIPSENSVLSAAAESRAKILFLPRYLIWSSQHKYL